MTTWLQSEYSSSVLFVVSVEGRRVTIEASYMQEINCMQNGTRSNTVKSLRHDFHGKQEKKLIIQKSYHPITGWNPTKNEDNMDPTPYVYLRG